MKRKQVGPVVVSRNIKIKFSPQNVIQIDLRQQKVFTRSRTCDDLSLW